MRARETGPYKNLGALCSPGLEIDCYVQLRNQMQTRVVQNRSV